MTQTKRGASRHQSMKMAFCGMITAISVVLMLTGGLIPIMTYCAPMASSLLLLPVMLEYDKKAAWTVYAAISLIVLFLGADKEAVFFFIFIGYYPILKWQIDRRHTAALRAGLKLLVFNVSILSMYAILGFVLHMDAIVAEFSEMGAWMLALFVVALNACLFLYDRLLFPLSLIYLQRVQPMLKFLRS